MKCHIMQHFLLIYTVCESTRLGVSHIFIKEIQCFFQQFWEKALGQNWEKIINLTSKLGEINDIEHNKGWERSGSVVECLTRDRRAMGSSLTGVTVLWSLSKAHLS